MLALRFFFLSLLALTFVGCASGKFKARQEQREKLAASSGMYCEFISGDLYPDLDVELSMAMAKRCDATKQFTITNYKNSSDHNGVIYCCSMAAAKRAAAAKRSTTPSNSTAPNASTDEVVSE